MYEVHKAELELPEIDQQAESLKVFEERWRMVEAKLGPELLMDRKTATLKAEQLAEKEFVLEHLVKKAGETRHLYDEFSLDNKRDAVNQLGIITMSPELLKANAETAKSLKGLAEAWEWVKPEMFQSGRETLLRMGREGEEITHMLDSATHLARRLSHRWSVQSKDALQGLKRGELDQVADLLENSTLKIDPTTGIQIALKSPNAKNAESWQIGDGDTPKKLREAAVKIANLFAEMGRAAEDSGVRIKSLKKKDRKFPKPEDADYKTESAAEQAGVMSDWFEERLGYEKFESIGRDFWPRLIPKTKNWVSEEDNLIDAVLAHARENVDKGFTREQAIKLVNRDGVDHKTGEINFGIILEDYHGEKQILDYTTGVLRNIQTSGKKGDAARRIAGASLQHARQQGEPIKGYKYRKDIGVVEDHIRAMSNVIAQTEHFGPIARVRGNHRSKLQGAINRLDRSDVDSSGKLIEGGFKDPEGFKKRELAERVVSSQLDALDRTDYSARIIAAATNYQMFTKLSYHFVSNFSANAQSILRSEGTSTFKAVGRYFTDAARSREIADESGARNIIMSSMVEGASKHGEFAKKVARWFGINYAENRERRFAANIGEGTTKYLWKQYTRNNANQSETAKLKDLLGKSDTELQELAMRLDGDELADRELFRAAGRFAEMAQGLAEGKNLPIMWTESSLLQIPLQFKKFAFQGTKTIKDGLKEHPVRNTALIGVLGQLFGEAVGGTKATLTGISRGATESLLQGTDPVEQIGKAVGKEAGYPFADDMGYRRQLDLDILGDSETSDYISWGLANTVDSWVAGLASDVLMASARGAENIESWIFGPTVEDIKYGIQGVYGAAYGGAQMLRGEEPTWGYMKPFARQLGRSIPFWGRGGQRAVGPTPRQEYGSGGGGRSRRRSRRGSRSNRL